MISRFDSVSPSRTPQLGNILDDFAPAKPAFDPAASAKKGFETEQVEALGADLLADFGAEPARAGREIEAIDTFEAEKTCPRPDLAERILEATRDLSLTQAVNPGEKDHVGFSNADYPSGSILAASGAVRASALLLLNYPRQSAGYGLKTDDLAWALPDSALGLPVRSASTQALRGVRDGARNSIAWAEKEDTVVLVGYSLGWEDKKLLKGLGTQTPQGFEIDKNRLGQVLDKVQATLIGTEGLREIARNTPQIAPPQKQDGPAMGAKAITVTAQAARVKPYAYSIAYTDPWSPEGQMVKDAIKKLGSGWEKSQIGRAHV